MGHPSNYEQRYVGKLKVTVHQGNELPNKDLGIADPFAILQIGNDKFKTKTHNKGGPSPIWDHSLVFNLDCPRWEVLHVQVWDEDLIQNEKLGRADIRLPDLMEQTSAGRSHWFQLLDFDNSRRIAGSILLSCEFTPASK